MRCKFCGSRAVHPNTQHKNFSGGKAVAGAVAFGVVGAAAGFIGKEVKGYTCGSCGAFMKTPMDGLTERKIDEAINSGDKIAYNFYKQQYPNIEASISSQQEYNGEAISTENKNSGYVNANANVLKSDAYELKNSFKASWWDSDCPIYIKGVSIFTKSGNDYAALHGLNISNNSIKSAYFTMKIFDDTGDIIDTIQFVYQDINIDPGDELPQEIKIDLKTNIAYSAEVICEKIAYLYGDTWRNNDENKRLKISAQRQMSEFDTLFKYAKESLTQCCRVELDEIYYPVKHEDVWQCVCGVPNLIDTPCAFCGAEYEQVEKIMTTSYLEEQQRKTIEKNVQERASECIELYNEAAERAYQSAKEIVKDNTSQAYFMAAEKLKKIENYKDAKELVLQFESEGVERKRIELEKEEKREKERLELIEQNKLVLKKKRKKLIKTLIAVFVPIVVFITILSLLISTSIEKKENNYNEALALLKRGKYEESIELFLTLNGYKDSEEKIHEAELTIEKERKEAEELENNYEKALQLFNDGEYRQAYEYFISFDNYKDSIEMANESFTQYCVETFNELDSRNLIVDNIDYYQFLSQKNVIKNILVGNWYVRSANATNYDGVGDYLILNQDGGGEKDEASGKKDVSWDVSDDGYLYYSESSDVDLSEIKYRKEVVKLMDGVYMLVNRSNNVYKQDLPEYLLISENSQCAERIKNNI